MALAQLSEYALATKPLVDFFASVGLVGVFGAVLLAVLKRNSDLRRWRHFKVDLEGWATALISQQARHPKELSDDEWRAECETMLYDAQFTPIEISQLIELAIIVAKATTVDILDTRTR